MCQQADSHILKESTVSDIVYRTVFIGEVDAVLSAYQWVLSINPLQGVQIFAISN